MINKKFNYKKSKKKHKKFKLNSIKPIKMQKIKPEPKEFLEDMGWG